MRPVHEWIAENIGYRFFGCFYTKAHQPLFDFIKTKISKDFIGKEICDLGCGDGSNTERIIEVFKPKSITCYDHNEYLVKKAKEQGLDVEQMNLNIQLPKGEMATMTFALHHIKDKEKALRKLVKNFKYIFLCEPERDLYHALLDGGETLPREEWIALFDKVLKNYDLCQYKGFLIVFYKNSTFP